MDHLFSKQNFFNFMLSDLWAIGILITLISVFQIKAQNPTSVCYFGSAALDFRTDNPTALTNSAMLGYNESSASICDENGNILFYTNGGNSPTIPASFGAVWNKNNQVMENGLLKDSAGCVSSYQGAIIVPFPNSGRELSQNLYYLFTRDCIESSFNQQATNSGLTYAIIDMNANSGNGKVISKYNLLVPYQISGSHKSSHEPVSAILHGNNKDYWLLSYTLNKLHRLLINENGISEFYIYDNLPVSTWGKINFSPLRNFLCAGEKLFSFNPFTAELNYILSFSDDFSDKNAFSPDGLKLYRIENKILYQYRLDVGNILSSRTVITNLNENYRIFLAPNAKIYLFKSEQTSLPGVVNCPNQIGFGCNFTMTPTSLNGKSCSYDFTNLMAHFLYNTDPGCGINNIEDQVEISGFKVYPNPSDGLFYFEVPDGFYGAAKVYNSIGQLVDLYNVTQEINSFNLDKHQKGIYLVRFTNSKNNIEKKIKIILR